MKNVFNSQTNILFSTIFSKISEYILYRSYLFCHTTYCQLPITLSTSEFPQGYYYQLSYLLPHLWSLPAPMIPYGREKTLRGLLKICEDMFGCHQSGIGGRAFDGWGLLILAALKCMRHHWTTNCLDPLRFQKTPLDTEQVKSLRMTILVQDFTTYNVCVSED